jgi:hypothetical protein
LVGLCPCPEGWLRADTETVECGFDVQPTEMITVAKSRVTVRIRRPYSCVAGTRVGIAQLASLHTSGGRGRAEVAPAGH